jgi:hypothetical protein
MLFALWMLFSACSSMWSAVCFCTDTVWFKIAAALRLPFPSFSSMRAVAITCSATACDMFFRFRKSRAIASSFSAMPPRASAAARAAFIASPIAAASLNRAFTPADSNGVVVVMVVGVVAIAVTFWRARSVVLVLEAAFLRLGFSSSRLSTPSLFALMRSLFGRLPALPSQTAAPAMVRRATVVRQPRRKRTGGGGVPICTAFSDSLPLSLSLPDRIGSLCSVFPAMAT